MAQKQKTKLDTRFNYTEEEFNTCNTWGFGGGVGTSYKFDHDIELRKGKAYCRHAPATSFVTVSKDGHRVFDKNNLKEALQLVTDLIAKQNENN